VVLVITPTDSLRSLKDIKGDNVLVTTTERNGLKEFVVKLIDFGCAKKPEEKNTGAKKPGVDDDGVALEMSYSLVFCFLESLNFVLQICMWMKKAGKNTCWTISTPKYTMGTRTSSHPRSQPR
jgi:serine/threonine protein kinase